MKLTILMITVTMCYCQSAISQAPFTIPVKDPIKLKTKIHEDGREYYEAVDKATDVNEDIHKGKVVSFFNNNALSYSLLNIGENRLSVSSQVIHYKLFFGNPTKESFELRHSQTKEAYNDRIQKYRINLPILVISKLSTNYDSSNSASALDLVDYEAAPITIRTMPSFAIPLNKDKTDKLFWGFYIDMRALNIRNGFGNNTLEIVGGSGIGITYTGAAEVMGYNDNGNFNEGTFSISLILQAATGEKHIMQQLYKTNDQYVMSFQGYLIINSLVNRSLNLKIGYQQLFNETVNGLKTTFSIAFGV